VVHLARHRSVGQDPGGLLERCRGNEAFRGQRGLSDPEQEGVGEAAEVVRYAELGPVHGGAGGVVHLDLAVQQPDEEPGDPLDRAVLQDFTTLNLAVFIPFSIVVMVSWAMVYGEIRLLTNSIWPAVLMHMVEDAFLNQLFTEHHIQIIPGTDWLVSPMNGFISIFFFIVLGVVLRQLRKRKQSVT